MVAGLSDSTEVEPGLLDSSTIVTGLSMALVRVTCLTQTDGMWIELPVSIGMGIVQS